MPEQFFIEMAREIYGIAHRRMNRKYKVAAIAEYLEKFEKIRKCAANYPNDTDGFCVNCGAMHNV